MDMDNSANEIKVSVICNAYNHSQYIRDALEGFVSQKTNFLFEVLIHDDASTDHTADIIREYEEKYPEIVKPIYQTENQYSKGLGAPRIFQEPRVKGKYIAFCEGDDYWTDPLKLQKQYDAMEAHPEVDICAHASTRVDAETGKELSGFRPANKTTVLSFEDVILGGGGYVATVSIFYRTEIMKNPPNFRKFMYLDYTLQLAGALRGGMLYLNDCMSVYRYKTAGSWTVRILADNERILKHKDKTIEMLRILNADTHGKYETAINARIRFVQMEKLIYLDKYKEILSKEYKDVFKQLPVKTRISTIIKAYFPFIIKAKRRIGAKVHGK